MRWLKKQWLLSLLCIWMMVLLSGRECFAAENATRSANLHVGAAAVELEADDSMIIAGGILPGKAKGQEGKLRAVAVVVEKGGQKVAIVACDILMITRDLLDPVVEEIQKKTGIPSSNVMINCTHTHHAPSCTVLHGYGRDETFCKTVQRAIVIAVQEANTKLATDDCSFSFYLGQEKTVGMNSRLMLSDGTIFWVGKYDDLVRPTGPFDPELPVLAFRNGAGKLVATIFNHSTHTIGTRKGGVRSPSFYGLAAQEAEEELGGIVCFLEGASGSTHRLNATVEEAIGRIRDGVREGSGKSEARQVSRVVAVKKPLKFKVRHFDETAEDQAVVAYVRKRVGGVVGESFIKVFRDMRAKLSPLQGQERETWVQVLVIGDVAIVGVPGEFFTKLGLDIKNRSPFRYTYVA